MIYMNRRLITAHIFFNVLSYCKPFAAYRKNIWENYCSFDDSNDEIPLGLICRYDDVPCNHGVKRRFYRCPSNWNYKITSYADNSCSWPIGVSLVDGRGCS